jgi:hypothetical protein
MVVAATSIFGLTRLTKANYCCPWGSGSSGWLALSSSNGAINCGDGGQLCVPVAFVVYASMPRQPDLSARKTIGAWPELRRLGERVDRAPHSLARSTPGGDDPHRRHRVLTGETGPQKSCGETRTRQPSCRCRRARGSHISRRSGPRRWRAPPASASEHVGTRARTSGHLPIVCANRTPTASKERDTGSDSRLPSGPDRRREGTPSTFCAEMVSALTLTTPGYVHSRWWAGWWG